MTMETELSQTEYDAFRPRTTIERENDCSAASGVLHDSGALRGRRLNAVPPYDEKERVYEEPVPSEAGGTVPAIDGRFGRNRSARRIEGRRMRAALRMEGGGLSYRDAGMATAEYAIATLAAVGFAALLVAVLSSGQIKGLLTSLITTALNFG